MKYSVIVVGAGASGVATATRLLQGGIKNIGKFCGPYLNIWLIFL